MSDKPPPFTLPPPPAAMSPAGASLPPPLASVAASSPLPPPIMAAASAALPPPIVAPAVLPPPPPTAPHPLDMVQDPKEDEEVLDEDGEAEIEESVPELTEEELAQAAVAIQSAFRAYKQRKAYRTLYESRRWTLHKEGQVLTDHVTKSRVGGRPGRRPPTRGKRVVGLEKPTAEPTRVMPDFSTEQASEGDVNVREGATRSSKPRPLSTSMFGGPGGLQFDPSKVQLRSSPGPVERNSHSVNSSPIARLKGVPRPLSMSVGPLSPGKDDALSAENRSHSVGITMNVPPPKPTAPTKQAKINPALLVTEEPVMEVEEEVESPPDAPPPTPPTSSPSAPPPLSQVEQKRKTRVGRILTTFLTKRPARSTLVENGILQADEFSEAQCPPPATSADAPADDPIAKRPALIPGKVCNDPRCKKKIKGKKAAHCLRCGKVFCKSTCLLFKTDMPELGYMEEVFICATCFQLRITEGHARSKG